MARLLTVDEIINGEGMGWMEYTTREMLGRRQYSYGITRVGNEYDDNRGYTVDLKKTTLGYGTEWRMWDSKPTKEEIIRALWYAPAFRLKQEDAEALGRDLMLMRNIVSLISEKGKLENPAR